MGCSRNSQSEICQQSLDNSSSSRARHMACGEASTDAVSSSHCHTTHWLVQVTGGEAKACWRQVQQPHVTTLAKFLSGYCRNQAVQHRPVEDPVAELLPAGHSAVPGLLRWPALLPCLPCLHHDRVQASDTTCSGHSETDRKLRFGASKLGADGSHICWYLRGGPTSKSTQRSQHSKEGGQG